MQIAVSNTGPLIWLAKVEALYILRNFYREIIIPEAVYREAVRQGLAKGYRDAERIKEAVSRGWIKIVECPQEWIVKVESMEGKLGIQLGAGEREAIALALSLKAETILTNDKVAAHVAETLNLKPIGVFYILLKAVREKLVTRQEARQLLERMVEQGFWITPKLIMEFYKTLEKI